MTKTNNTGWAFPCKLGLIPHHLGPKPPGAPLPSPSPDERVRARRLAAIFRAVCRRRLLRPTAAVTMDSWEEELKRFLLEEEEDDDELFFIIVPAVLLGLHEEKKAKHTSSLPECLLESCDEGGNKLALS
ncbi:hypothetical protein U9M48_043835 [Paspalum notatum var. saurae]|uniref:Uncharacterized protein n=1 Tax=Paspalum notatum var. saurae TaxID=547442 RepID=A0AAQ3XHJ0_PASNO